MLEAEEEAEAALAAEGAPDEDEEEGEEGRPTAEERVYLAKVDAGLSTLAKIDLLLGYLATAKAKPLRVAVLSGLYEQGSSLHAVAEHVDDERKMLQGDGARADTARDTRLAAMSAAVQAILLKYVQPADDAGAEAAAADGEAAAS